MEMGPDSIIVRFGELTLKGRNRHRFENKILRQIRTLLQPYANLAFSVEFGRLYIELHGEPYNEITENLRKVFGLSSFSVANKTVPDLEAIRKTAFDIFSQIDPKPKTFKVSVKRANKQFPHDSLETANLVGGYVLRLTPALKVDVHKPEVELTVDIRDHDVYVFAGKEMGTGGYPLGSNGKAMLMLSGGIDSPVAGWLSMRRGLEIEAVHFHSFPFTSEKAQQKVVDLTAKLSEYADGVKLHMVPFTDIQTGLNREGKENVMITLMRRAMFRITERLAERNGAAAIITGENLGQVASQTLSSLSVIGRVAEMPLLRPLITMDKNEIIRIAEEIGTYPISILPYEDCCTLFLPRSPSTNPSLRLLERLEAGMPWLNDAIAAAVEKTETTTVRWNEDEAFDDYF
jgi:thiamine biosynthesis protein ThiI